MKEINANVAISMIYGDTTNLDISIDNDFESVGVSHLMSVSGTHITSFMVVVNAILKVNKQKNIKKKMYKKTNTSVLKAIVQIVSICVYIIFTGFSISVIRAGIMLIISILCNLFNKRKSSYKALIITFVMMFLYNPYIIFNIGIQLSFLATLGIILFAKYIYMLLSKMTYKLNNEMAKKVVKLITENVAITIAVQIMIIPIQIHSFNKLPFPIILPNLILGFICIPIRILGTLGIMLAFIPTLSYKIFGVLELLVQVLIVVVKGFKKISYTISTASMPVVYYVVYYIFVLCIFIFLKLKSIMKLKKDNGKYNFTKLLKGVKIFVTILFITLIVVLVSINIYSIYFSEYVYFFNVEQGDMSYIKSGAKSVIVDIGSIRDDLSFNVISNYFKSNNLTKVDAVIVSHIHKDHVNGLELLLQNYKVDNIIYAKPKTKNKEHNEFEKMLANYDVNIRLVSAGEVIYIGNIKVEVLLPDKQYIDSTDEINANSLICNITVNNKSLLYMGDALIETEQELMKKYNKLKDIYILKVGHHGSKTSTSEQFIQMIKPQNAIISAAKRYYGHPHEVIITTLNKNNVYTYITEKNGAIKFKLN